MIGQEAIGSEGYSNYENPRGNIEAIFRESDLNKDPGVIQDVETWKGLKKAKEDIRKNKKKIWISFFMEFIVFLFFAAACAYFINMER